MQGMEGTVTRRQRPITVRHQTLVRLDDELYRLLDEFRFTSRFKSEAAAVRALMKLGFKHLGEAAEPAA